MTTPSPSPTILGASHDRTDSAKGRTYRWGKESFASVTTIIGGGVPKPALLPWGINMVAAAAVELYTSGELHRLMARNPKEAIAKLKASPYDKRDRAANLGSAVHKAAEAHILGTPHTPEADARPYILQFVRFVAEHQPVYHAAECTVYSRVCQYAGTLDAVVEIGGRRLVLDYKTSGSGVYPEAVLQLSAYRYAEFVGLPDGGEHPVADLGIDGAAVLWLKADGYSLVPVRADREAFDYFQHARSIYEWAQVGKSFLEVG